MLLNIIIESYMYIFKLIPFFSNFLFNYIKYLYLINRLIKYSQYIIINKPVSKHSLMLKLLLYHCRPVAKPLRGRK